MYLQCDTMRRCGRICIRPHNPSSRARIKFPQRRRFLDAMYVCIRTYSCALCTIIIHTCIFPEGRSKELFPWRKTFQINRPPTPAVCGFGRPEFTRYSVPSYVCTDRIDRVTIRTKWRKDHPVTNHVILPPAFRGFFLSFS